MKALIALARQVLGPDVVLFTTDGGSTSYMARGSIKGSEVRPSALSSPVRMLAKSCDGGRCRHHCWGRGGDRKGGGEGGRGEERGPHCFFAVLYGIPTAPAVVVVAPARSLLLSMLL